MFLPLLFIPISLLYVVLLCKTKEISWNEKATTNNTEFAYCEKTIVFQIFDYFVNLLINDRLIIAALYDLLLSMNLGEKMKLLFQILFLTLFHLPNIVYFELTRAKITLTLQCHCLQSFNETTFNNIPSRLLSVSEQKFL